MTNKKKGSKRGPKRNLKGSPAKAPQKQDQKTEANVERSDIKKPDIEKAEIEALKPQKTKPEKTKTRKTKLRGLKIFAAILLIAVLTVGFVYGVSVLQSNDLERTFYRIESNKVSENIRVVFLSDLHLNEIGKDNSKLVNEVKVLHPDIIAIGGDMNRTGKEDYSVVISLCSQLKDIAPVYYALGNHEAAVYYNGNNKLFEEVKKLGITVLNTEFKTITVNNTTIDIGGLTSNPWQFTMYNAKKFMDGYVKNDNNFKLLLNHYPEFYLEEVPNGGSSLLDYKVDLALSGHAHGGQIRLPFVGGLYSSDQGFLPSLTDGLHDFENTDLIISRGLGNSHFLPRFNNKPELVIIDINWY